MRAVSNKGSQRWAISMMAGSRAAQCKPITLMGNREGKSIRESRRSVGAGAAKDDADMQCFQFNSKIARKNKLWSWLGWL